MKVVLSFLKHTTYQKAQTVVQMKLQYLVLDVDQRVKTKIITRGQIKVQRPILKQMPKYLSQNMAEGEKLKTNEIMLNNIRNNFTALLLNARIIKNKLREIK